MSFAKFEVNSNLDDEVAKLPEVKASSKDAVEAIAEIARDTAPVLTGDYQRGIVTQETKTGYRVLASDQKSAWVEFGIPSQGQPAHWTLRRAVEAAGYKFKKKGT